MNEVTRILSAIERGEPLAAEQLLPLIYDELRRLADLQLAHEPAGLTLQPTALVHEAYLRLLGGDPGRRWDGRRHYYGAAAEAMRRILVEAARRRGAKRHGGGRARLDVDVLALAAPETDEELLALDEALGRLVEADPQAARLVSLRYFAGLTISQAAEALGVSARTADRLWAYARAWLYREMHPG